MLSTAITACLFVGVGVLAARLFALPARRRTWILLMLAVVVGSVVGTDTSLLSVYGFDIRLNRAVASCCLGTLAGLWQRSRKIAAV